MRRLDSTINSMNMRLSKLQKAVRDKDAWSAAVHGVTEVGMTEQLKTKKPQFKDWEGVAQLQSGLGGTGLLRGRPGCQLSMNWLP